MEKFVYLAAPEIEGVFGTPDAIDDIDAVTAALIIDVIRTRPALGRDARVALAAIAEVARHNPDAARQMAAELKM